MEVSGQFHASAALPPGKESRYPMERRLGAFQSRSKFDGEEKNSKPPPGIEPSNPNQPAHILVTIPTELSLLLLETIHNTLSFIKLNVRF
jgi:hypothetical protein